MQHDHSTGLAGSHSNVYRLPNAPDVLRSRKPRNRFRTLLEKLCALKPESRLRVIKAMLAEFDKSAESSDVPKTTKPPHWPASFYIRNGISRDLWERRYGRAQDEAWQTERIRP